MKLLQCGGDCHYKNMNAIKLMTSSLEIDYINSNDEHLFLNDWDFVFIPSNFIPAEKFPNAKIILYGPQNFTFPEGLWTRLDYKNDKRIYYICLSKWIENVFNEIANFKENIKMLPYPFAVDVDRFKPAEHKVYERDCFIYMKRRKHHEIEKVKAICDQLKLSYSVITYGSYKEADLIHLCNTSKFAILLDCHESQGFAVQEIMSMNAPLVVWDAKDMFVEGYEQYRGRYQLKSTSITTWDDTCGIVADEGTIDDCIKFMAEHYRDYSPRDLIVRELSPAVCMERWLSLIEK